MGASFGVSLMRQWLAAVVTWISAVAIGGGVLVLVYFLVLSWWLDTGFPYVHAFGCAGWLFGWSWVALSVLFLNPDTVPRHGDTWHSPTASKSSGASPPVRL